MEALTDTEKKIYTDSELVYGLQTETNSNVKRILQNEFYRRFKNHVYKNALNACRDYTDGEQLAIDIHQEVFINAFKSIDKFRFPDVVEKDGHQLIIKGWLGIIGNNLFKKLYTKRKVDVIFDSELIENNEPYYDLFENLYGKEDDVEVPNEFREKLQVALNQLNEKQLHIIRVYASEGCIGSHQHLGTTALKELCALYETSPENIRQIKKRALDKIKAICFPPTN